MDLERQDHDAATVIRCLDNRLDALIAVQFKERFRDLGEDAQNRVILDMAEVSFMDSSGLGAVVAVYKLLGTERRFDLAGLTPAVDRVFRLTRMDSVFAIYPTLAEALAASGGKDEMRTAS